MSCNKELLSQIIDNLILIRENNEPFSAITKDIVLQNLREAYLTVLKTETKDVIEEFENQNYNIKRDEQKLFGAIEKTEVENLSETLDENEEIVEDIPNTEEISEEKLDERGIEEEQEIVSAELNLEEDEIVEDIPEETEEVSEEPVKNEEEPVKTEEEFEGKLKDEVEEKSEKTAPKEPEETLDVESALKESIEEMDNDILQFLIPETKEEVKEVELKVEAKPVEQPVVEEKKEEPAPNVSEKEKPEPQPVAEEKVKEEKPKEVSSKTEAVQKEISLFPEEPSVSKTDPQQRSLNDLFNAQKKDNSLSNKFQQTKVQDLTKAISINDKFLFIRELFKNKSEEFSRAIQTLNNCETIEEAFDVMEGLKKHYFWDSTSSAYLTLCDLVRRKF